MTEVETKVKSGVADEESAMSEATAYEAQVEAGAPVVVPEGMPQKEAADGDSNAEPFVTVTVKATEIAPTEVEDELGATDEQKEKSFVEKEDKAEEVGNEKCTTKGVVMEGTKKEDALKDPASRIQKGKEVALANVTTPVATAQTIEENKKTAVESTLCAEGEKKKIPNKRKKRSASGKKAKKLQKVKTATSANAETAKVDKEEKTDVSDKDEASLSNEEGNMVSDETRKVNKNAKGTQEMKTTALTIATASAAITAETATGNSEKEVAGEDKVDASLSKKNKNKNKKKKKNKARGAAEAAGDAKVGDVKKPSVAKEPSGMIFMCNAETKKDCYMYKIFGMPTGKKETVAKVYKGMKLFLFDIDLKLLYGIYVSTSKGGYNIQPKAFKSAFPSQVRFKVFKDCLPLPEEKFKSALKPNYYKKNKFNLELSAEQVQKLSKLFVDATNATKGSKRTTGRSTRERAPQKFNIHDTRRRQFHGTVSRPLIDDDRTYPRSFDIYQRDGYAAQVPLEGPLPPPGSAVRRQAPFPMYSSPPGFAPPPALPPAVYAYDRPRDVDYYGRELPTEALGRRVYNSEIRPSFDPVGHDDPYSLHTEPAPYREIRYPTILPSSYHPPPPPYRY